MKTQGLVACWLLLLILPATAHHEEDGAIRHAVEVYDGTGSIAYCDARGEIAIGDIYIHDRHGALGVVGTGMVTITENSGAQGTWIYQESNGIPGLQIGVSNEPFAESINEIADEHTGLGYTSIDTRWGHCPNADTVVF